VSALSVIPLGRANFECVNDYPDSLQDESYVYAENATQEDLYAMTDLVATLPVEINSVTPTVRCRRDNALAACTAELSINPGAISRSAANALTEVYTNYTNEWAVNPFTDDFWTIANVNGLTAGMRMGSAAAGTEARCTQMFISVDVTILREVVTNVAGLFSDDIHVNQMFAVHAEESSGRSLHGATTARIIGRDPGGTEHNYDGNIVDDTRILAPVPAADNTVTGKWMFSLYAVLAGGEILEGPPFFANVQPRWI
jgi:hypothetical protein